MTNGEKIKQMFPDAEYTTDMCTCVNMRPLKDGEWASKFGWSFDIDWWNAEYKEPNTKFQEKIANAKPSTWLTDGLTDEEVKQIVDNAKKQARRNCEKCKHRIPTVDIVKCKPVYGCELWECKFEQKEVEK